MMRMLMALLLVLGMAACSNTDPGVNLSEAARINTQLGLTYLRQGNLRMAKEKIDKALTQDDRQPEVHLAAGFLYQRLEQPARAERHFRRAIELDPENPDLHNNFGSFLCAEGRYEEGVAEFTRAMDNPLYQTPQYAATNIGLCYIKAGKLGRAETFLRKALDYDRKFPAALFQMARLSFLNGRYLATRAYLQRLSEVHGDTPQTLWLCFQAERQLGDETAAAQCAERLLERYPESREAERLRALRGDR